MCVTLAAVSDHGDDAVLQPGGIGVGIVENARFRRAHRFASVEESSFARTITERTPIILCSCCATRSAVTGSALSTKGRRDTPAGPPGGSAGPSIGTMRPPTPPDARFHGP